MEAWMEWGIELIVQLQSLGTGLIEVMKLFTFMGDEEFYLLFMPVLVWCFDVSLGLRIGLILLTSAGINDAVKIAFGLPRPYWVSKAVKAYTTGSSFGLPSGHAQTAVATWGRVASWVVWRWVRVLLVIIILLISVSRWFLGVHFPMDTFVGWGIGAVILFAFVRWDKSVSARVSEWRVTTQVGAGLLISLLLLALTVISLAFLAPDTIPSSWESFAESATPESGPIDPLSIVPAVSIAGTLFGITTGAALLYQWGGFHPGGRWYLRAARYLVGLVGMVVVFYGLRMIFPGGDDAVSMTLRYLRYALTGFWALYLAPRLFVLIRIAQGSET